MRGFVSKSVAMAALVAAIAVPAASAKSAATVKLSLVPLPKSALGVPGQLPLQRDSGTVSDAIAASNASGKVSPRRVKALGRVTGYLLDYGTPFGAGAGVHQAQTEVDQYKSAADATKALAFWKKDEVKIAALRKLGFDISVRKLSLAGAGSAHWAYLGTVRVKGLQPVYAVDEQAQEGNYLLDVSASGGSASAVEALAPKLTKKIDARLRLGLAGKLGGRPVKLLPPLKAGPPPHGPKPTSLVLKSTDVGSGQVTVRQKAYTKNSDAISEYDLEMAPAGSYAFLAQSIVVFDSSLAAKYYSAIFGSALASAAVGGGGKFQPTPVDLSSVGDNAYGELIHVQVNGQDVYEGVVVLSRGAILDSVVVASQAQIAESDLQQLAQAAANRLNAG